MTAAIAQDQEWGKMRTHAVARAGTIFAVFAVAMLHASLGHAAQITVSVYGSDTATCGSTTTYPFTPCRTLQYAIDKASPGDTVYLQIVGGYGPATIAKTINILGAVGAGIYAPVGVPCLTINGGVNDVISVTGLICDQAGAAKEGILFNSGRRLDLTDVDLRRGGSVCGVRFQPNSNAELGFLDLTITAWGVAACIVPRAGADVAGVVENAGFYDDQYGLYSVAGAGSVIAVSCDGCNISGGGTGIYSNGATSVLRIKNSLISENTTGLSRPNSGQVVSNGGNSIIANATNGTVSSTVPPL